MYGINSWKNKTRDVFKNKVNERQIAINNIASLVLSLLTSNKIFLYFLFKKKKLLNWGKYNPTPNEEPTTKRIRQSIFYRKSI